MPYTRANGTTGKKVTAYIVDMNSANGTFINNEKVEPQRYVELKERDVLKFGFSSREYVMLHDQVKDDAEDDLVWINPNPIQDNPNQSMIKLRIMLRMILV